MLELSKLSVDELSELIFQLNFRLKSITEEEKLQKTYDKIKTIHQELVNRSIQRTKTIKEGC